MVIIALLAHTGSGTDLETYPSKRTYLMAGNLVFATDKAAKKRVIINLPNGESFLSLGAWGS